MPTGEPRSRRRNPDTTATLATVCILTFNAERYLADILRSLRTQEIDGPFDVLVIDSGSTDGTLGILGDFPEVRLHEIPNSAFGHGKTRNLAARLSRGEYTAFLTHDAVPAGPHWLAELVRPMRVDPQVACVYGRQIPRAGCFPLLKYEINGVFAAAGAPYGITIVDGSWLRDDKEALARASFYSDVNSAARTSVLRDRVPYRDVEYAEDQLFGRDILEAGLRKAYAPSATVVHSNDLNLGEYRRRIVDEGVGLRRAGFPYPRIGWVTVARRVVRGSLGDAVRIARDRDYGPLAKVGWWTVTPWYHVAKWRGMRLASRVRLDAGPDRRHSLEATRRASTSARPE